MSSAKPIREDVWLEGATATQEESEPKSCQVGAAGGKRTAGARAKEKRPGGSKAPHKNLVVIHFSPKRNLGEKFTINEFALANSI